MQKRRVGKTNIDVSVIGLGTVKFGRNQGVKYPAAFQLPSDSELDMLLGFAAEAGINLLDTAPAYGSSEERLGKLLHGQRHDWVICTKAGEEFIDGQSQFDFSATTIQQSIERSLRRLRTDYLDIVLIHSNGDDQRIIEEEHVFSLLAALKKEGKVRAYGMSTKTITGGLLTVALADVAMVSFNPEYTEDQTVIDAAQKAQKGIFIKKALLSGHAAKPDEALRFAVSAPGVTSAIIGTINPQHLQENVAAIMR